MRRCEHALTLSEALIEDWGTPLERTQVIEARGVLAQGTGDPHTAATHYRHAAEAYAELGETRHAASATRGLGIALHLTGGNADEAREILRQAVLTAQSMENASGEAEALVALADLELRASNFDRAIEHFRASANLYRELGRAEQELAVRLRLAGALKAAGRSVEARRELHAIAKQAQVSGLRELETEALDRLAEDEN